MNNIQERLSEIAHRARAAAVRSGRDFSKIIILAATKTQSAEQIKAYVNAAAALNLTAVIGENYLQEFLEKAPVLSQLSLPFQKHFIGVLQSNKAKEAVKYFDVIEGIGSKSGYQALAKEAQKISKRQRIFLQVNISGDGNKGGFSAAEALEVAECVAADQRIELAGLMTVTKLYENPEDARTDFSRAKQLQVRIHESLRVKSQSIASVCCELSMGMSNDFEVAIEEGATIVRIGSAMFGERSK